MLEQLLNLFQGGIQPPAALANGIPARFLAVVDILLVAAIFYAAIRFLRRTRATNILWGFIAILIGVGLARLLGLNTLNAILTLFAALLVIALPLLFQPELRRGLERFGRFLPVIGTSTATLDEPILAALVQAIETLRTRRWGALIVLERQTYLSEYTDTGVPLHAEVRAPLLEALFSPESPLHDGAVIIRGETILAAGCTLPLTDHEDAPRGTRHRAAQGITEMSDAIALVVSEERGTISVAADGRLTTIRHAPDLAAALRTLLPATP